VGVPRPVLLALVWLLGVALATGTGLLAVRLVAEQVGDDALPTVDVRAALSGGPVLTTGGPTVPVVRPSAAPRPTGTRPTSASRPAATTRPAPQPTEVRTSAATSSATSSPRPTATPRTTAVSAPRTFSLTGGTVSVRCRGTAAELVYALPAQGFALDERSVSGSTAEVRFENDALRSRIEVTCSSGTPVVSDRRVEERSGGGDDD